MKHNFIGTLTISMQHFEVIKNKGICKSAGINRMVAKSYQILRFLIQIDIPPYISTIFLSSNVVAIVGKIGVYQYPNIDYQKYGHYRKAA